MNKKINKIKKYIKNRIPFLFLFFKKIESDMGFCYNKSYSQFGEDMVLSSIIDINKIGKGFYIDIGAYHPKKYSNSYFFYKRGWRGINIDAQPGSMCLFKKKRKRDINLEVGISKEEKELTFYVFEDGPFNTFSKELAENCIDRGYKLKEKALVKTMTLKNILNKYLSSNQKINFMSIDVEGFDLEVLESNDWNKYRPDFILTEMYNIDIVGIRESCIYKFLESNGYKLISVANITLIFENINNSVK